jgi:hypothetical protein
MISLKTFRKQIYNYCGNWFPHSFHNLSFLTDFNQFKPIFKNIDNTIKYRYINGLERFETFRKGDSMGFITLRSRVQLPISLLRRAPVFQGLFNSKSLNFYENHTFIEW